MSTLSIRGSVIQAYLVIEGQTYDITSVTSSEIGPIDNAQTAPSFVCRLTVGTSISALEQKYQVTPTQARSFLKYPEATVIVTVSQVNSTAATPFLPEGTYVLIDGDIVEATYSKRFESTAGAVLDYSIRIAHKLRRLMFGDLAAYPVYGWDIFIPRDYNLGGDTGFGTLYNGMVEQLKTQTGADLFNKFVKQLLLLRLNPKLVADKFGTEVAASDAARGTRFPEVIDAAFKALAGANLGSVTSITKDSLQSYASSALDLLVSKVFMAGDKVSVPNQRKLLNYLVTVMQNGLLTSDAETLSIVALFMREVGAWIVPNSVGGFIVPVPGIAPVSARKKIPLADYSSVSLETKDEGADGYVGGYVGFRPALQSGQLHLPAEEAGYVSVVNKPLGRGGLVRKINLPDWMSAGTANDEILEETLTEEEKANRLDQAGVSNTISLSAANPDINILATNFINYFAISEHLRRSAIKVLGPLRLDLGVGQPVEIELPAGDLTDDTYWYCGYVVALQFVLDADSGTVTTAYTLLGVAEKSIYDQYLDAGKHPFVVENEQSYSTTWSAAQNPV